MNFTNPYYYTFPMPANYMQPKIGILGRLFGRTGISISNFLNGTQRVLNIANQTIPLVKQVRPMIGNAKTMFKVMNEFKRVEKSVSKDTSNIEISETKEDTKPEEYIVNQTEEGPTFFI